LATERERQIAEHTARLKEASETIELLERRLSEANAAGEGIALARNEWQRDRAELARQQAELLQRISELEAQLADAEARAAAIPAAAPDAHSRPWGSELPEAASSSFADASPLETSRDPGCETVIPESEPVGEYDWSTIHREAPVDAGAECEANPFADSPASKAPEVEFAWGQESAQAEWPVSPDEADEPNLAACERSAPAIMDNAESDELDQNCVTSPASVPQDAWGLSTHAVDSAKAQPSSVEPASELPRVVENASSAQTTSYIERYSHMFAEENVPQDRPLTAPVERQQQQSPREIQKPRTVGIVRSGTSSAAPGGEDEEESIEQYMAKLLQRVRGDSAPAQASIPEPQTTRNMPISAPMGFGEAPLQCGQVGTGDTLSPGSGPLETIARFDSNRPKLSLPSQQTDLEALRALANESARRAISRHALRKHRRNALTKVIVSTLAGVTSLWMMLEAGKWLSLQFITACVAMLVAAYWGGETFRTLLESFKVAAYDEADEEIEELSAQLQSPLPIDIENTKSWAVTDSDAGATAAEPQPEPVA
jgi:hypothetical protein